MKRKKKEKEKISKKEIFLAYLSLTMIFLFFIATLFVMFNYFSLEGLIAAIILGLIFAFIMRKRRPHREFSRDD